MTEEEFLSHDWVEGEKCYTLEEDFAGAITSDDLYSFGVYVPIGIKDLVYTNEGGDNLIFICHNLYLRREDAVKALNEAKAEVYEKIGRKLAILDNFRDKIVSIITKYDLKKE